MTAGPVPSGLVVVDKPSGLTSHDVVARVRRLAGTRKVGHAGTLDPMATGVLVVGVERATRLLGHLILSEKSYDATVRLGAATNTDDAEGEVVSTADASAVGEVDVRKVLPAFTGDIEQRPSSVSAVKVAGERAYKRVRAGEQVDLPPRPVTVHDLTLHRVTRSGPVVDVDLSVRCSSGTYVRALARDLGATLGVGGHLVALRRTTVGPFTLVEATPLADLEASGALGPDVLVAMADAAARSFPTRVLDADQARAVSHGRALDIDLPEEPVALLGPDGSFLALYRGAGQESATARPVAVFV